MSVLGEALDGHGGGDEHVSAVLGRVGAVLGELAHELAGAGAISVGKGHHHGHHMRRPHWREQELAPGVVLPGEGLVPLPMTPLQNNGLYANTTNGGPAAITFQGQIQVPFRSERLLAQSIRSGTTAQTGQRIYAQFFVGIGLQQAEIFGVDLELLGAPNAFDVRMTMIQAPPGVLLRALTTLTGVIPTAPDFVELPGFMFLGRVVH
jgi:hypothetical protein